MKKYLLFLLAIWMPMMAWAAAPTHTLTIKAGAKFYITVSKTDGTYPSENVVKEDPEYIVTYPLTEGDTYTITIDPLKYENDYIYSQFTAWMRDDAFYSKSTELKLTMGKKDITLTAVSTRVAEPPYSPGANSFDAETGTLMLDEIRNARSQGINSAYRVAKAMYKFEDSDVQNIVVAGDLDGASISLVGSFGKFANLASLDMSQTSGMKTLLSSYYSGTNYKLRKLEHIALGASIENIAENAFYEISQLKTIDCYATTPPSCAPNAFDENYISQISLHVPAGCVEQYKQANGWKEFTEVSSLNEIGDITVKLPTNVPDGYYEDMTLELTNLRSQMVYTRKVLNKREFLFSGQIREAEYQATLKNSYGHVMGQTEAVELAEDKLTLTFDKLLQKKDVNLKVTTPEGADATEKVKIKWFDESGKVIGYDSRLKAVAEGSNLTCQISVGQGIARQYVAPPAAQFTVAAEGDNLFTIALLPVEQMALHGYVTDSETGDSIAGATIVITQRQSGCSDRSINATTGTGGRYELQGTNKPGEITVSAPGHKTKTEDFGSPEAGGELPTIVLDPKYDIIVSVWLTYTENAPEGDESEVIDGYEGYSDIVYQVYNKTMKVEVKDFEINERTLFFPKQVDLGNELTITATSRSSDFLPVSVDCVIGKHGLGSVTLPLVQTPMGSMTAHVSGVPDSVSVMGVLYHANGFFERTKTYRADSLSFEDLPEGDYNLISMTSNTLLRRTLLQSTLDDMGLVEGTDYKKTPVHVKRGQATSVNVGTVPALDMEKLHFTDKTTYFMAWQNMISLDQTSHINSRVQFAEQYAGRVSDVEVIVDIPDELWLVENSAIESWNSTCNYRIEDGRYIFPIKDLEKHKLEFSLRPAKAGEYYVSASVRFKLDEAQTIQPIGTIWIYVYTDFTMYEPMVTDDYNNIYVNLSGRVPGSAQVDYVDIYDFDKLVGKAKVNTWGNSWNIEIQYPKNADNYIHAIKARMTDAKTNRSQETEVQYVSYNDINKYAERVVMLTQKNDSITFNMVDNTVTPDHYTYILKPFWGKETPYNTRFTFLAYFDNLENPQEKKVEISVLASDGTIRVLDAKYNYYRQCFYATSDYSYSTKIPKAVRAYYIDDSFKPMSEEDKQVLQEDMQQRMDQLTQTAINFATKNGEIELLPSDDETLNFNYSVNGSDPFTFTTKEMDYDQAVNYVLNNNPLAYSNDEDSILYTFVNGKDEAEILLIDVTKHVALRTAITDAEISNPLGAPGRENAEPRKLRISGADRLSAWGNAAFAGSGLLTVMGFDPYLHAPERMVDMEVRAERFSRDPEMARDKVWEIIKGDCPDGKFKWSHDAWKFITTTDHHLMNEEIYTFKKLLELKRHYQSGLRDKVIWDVGTSVLSRGVSKAAATGAANFVGEKATSLLKTVREFSKTDKGKSVGKILGCAKNAVETEIVVPTVDEVLSIDFTRHYNEYDDFYNKQYNYIMSGWENFYQAVLQLPTECEEDGSDCEGDDCDPDNSDDPDDPDKDDENNDDDEDEKKNGNRNDDYTPPPSKPKHSKYATMSKADLDKVFEKQYRRQVKALVDPSGYIYEAVPSNRVEGATATIYYMDYMINSSGNSTGEQDVLWDAENYGQVNPQITDSTGMYQWDVPQGLWQVRVQKEGYESNQTEWLPVPPPQLDVNIPIVRNRLPKVEKAHAYEEAVTAKFDSYMLPELLNLEQIIVTENGAIVAGAIELTDAEAAPDGTTYASQFRFTPTTPFTANEVVLHISGAVQNYSGIEMDEPFEAVLPIEREVKTLVADRSVKVLYQHARVVHVKGEPAAAAAGKTISIKSASGIIATATENTVVLNKDGEADVLIQGDLPGVELITFNLDNPELSASTKVNVMESAPWWVDAPEASVPSETELERGATVTLSSQTEGAVIYYTLDGSNPYDSDTRILYNGTPVVINAETTLKAIAIVEDKGRSDVRTYHYTIKVGTEIRGVNGSDISVVPVRVHDSFEVSGVDGTFSVSVYSMTGQRLILSSQVRNGQRINATTLPTGVYLVVVSGDNTYSTHRIIKD